MIEDLGILTVPAAISGVEVTATIAAKGSVSFDFQAQAGGIYSLFVKYDGDGLTLNLSSPGQASSTTVQPGAPGAVHELDLPLDAKSYSIKASAEGDRPVFVDWEVFLNSGVGQANASALAPARNEAIPLPASGSGSGSASSGRSASAAPAPTMVLGGPVGRSEAAQTPCPVGPSLGAHALALAYAGSSLPEGVALHAASEISPDLTSVMASEAASAETSSDRAIPTLELLGDAQSNRRDLAALAPTTWLERTILDWGGPKLDSIAGDGGDGAPGDQAEGPIVLASGLDVPEVIPPERYEREAGMGPGLELVAATGLVVAVTRRARSRGRVLAPKDPRSQGPAARRSAFNASMA